jgi:murein DD-endopeptidase MepM/ murein hydrolase activator NlpD
VRNAPGKACAALAVGIALGAFACGDDASSPAATPGEEAATEETAAATETEATPTHVEHRLERGETLWQLGRAYGVPLSTILRENGLTERSARSLTPGKVLRIPGVAQVVHPGRRSEGDGGDENVVVPVDDGTPLADGAWHELAMGETIWDLARIYDKDVDSILTINGFTDDDVRALRAGQRVVVPGIRASEVRHDEPAAEASPRARRGRGITHRLRSGETIWDLARRYQVSVSELMSANGLTVGAVRGLQENAEVFIPGVTETARVHTRRLTPAQLRDRGRAHRLGLGTRRAASQLLRGQVADRWMTAAGGARLPGTLRWPVTHGRYVRGFGSGEGGYHLAVDIAGDIGWNVRSAGPGIVAYSDDGVRGYGNMVIVVHPGGWVTMYAHNSVNFVVPGQMVRTGSVLAELGSTGISRGPHVHFELMHGGRNCDPAHLFRPGVRHRSRVARIAPLTWTRPDARPDAIKCLPRRRHPQSRWVVDE